MSADVVITPLPAERLVAVHASPVEAVPLLAPFTALRLGPEEWLCLDTGVRAVEAALGSNALALDVGDAYEGWHLGGTGVRDWLARACAVDLARLPTGSATRVLMGAVGVVVRVVEDGYELRVDRSYAEWFATWMVRI